MAEEQAEDWEPTHTIDNVIVALSAVHHVTILVTVLHLAWTSSWPPYVAKNVLLLCTTGVSGAVWSMAIISCFGTYRREKGSIWAHCDCEMFLLWAGVGLLSNSGFLRIYRHWKILQKYDRKMWATEWQLLLLMVPFMIPSIFYFWRPDLLYFDPQTQECMSESSIVTPIMGAWTLVLLFWALYLVHRMRHLRNQFHEYELIRKVVVLIVLAPTLFIFIEAITGREHATIRRRLEILLSIVITGLLFWIPSYEAVWAFIKRDEAYLDLFAHGFYELPTPAQLRATLDDKLSIEELRQEFRRYAKTRVSHELTYFYRQVLERDTVDDYFERQAVTMKIIDDFIRRGSASEVPLSDACRRRILNSDVTLFDIFDEARIEVLKVMEDNFQRDFEKKAGYRRFRQEMEAHARDRLILIGSALLPVANPQCLPAVRKMGMELSPSTTTSSPNECPSLCYSSDGQLRYSSSSSKSSGMADAI